MSWLKYDRVHMSRTGKVLGKPVPFVSQPFSLSGDPNRNSFSRALRRLFAPFKPAICSALMNLFLIFCRIARAVFPSPRIGRLIFVTRDKDVREVLENIDVFAVPYTPEMIELAGGTNSILGMDPPEHTGLSNLIKNAMREVPTVTGQAMHELIKIQSAEVANALLDNSQGQIDVVTDLITRTLTETTCTYFGLKVDDPVEFAEWTMAISWLLFGDPRGSPSVKAKAMNAAGRLGQVIDQAIVETKTAAKKKEKPHGLIRALVDIQNLNQNGPENGRPSDEQIRATIMGLVVALIPTNTLAAGNMLEELLRKNRQTYWHKAISLAQLNDEKALTDLLLEAGRLRPALSPGLWRYVTETATISVGAKWWQRRVVHANDLVLAVIPSALRDRRVYQDNPNSFIANRQQYPDLMFGHGPHYCIGDRLAMIQITQIFKALLARNPEPAKRRRTADSIGPFPVRLDMKFAPDRKQSTMIIITAPTARQYVRSYEKKKEEIEEALSALGNPATDKIAASLDRTNVVHFASISVVESDSEHSKPPILIIEINADGPVEDVLRAFVDEGYEWLMPIFSYVTDRISGNKVLLYELLKLHTRVLNCSPFDPLGLHFDGMRQFSVRNIERQARLAAFARKSLDEHLKSTLDGAGRASDAISYVRKNIREDSRFSSDLLQPSRDTLDIATWREPRSFTAPFFSQVWRSRPILGFFATGLVIWFFLGATLYNTIYANSEPEAYEQIESIFLQYWVLFAAVLSSAIATFLLLAIVFLVFASLLIWHEKTDKSEDSQTDLEKFQTLAAIESQVGQRQNHILAVMALKRGWFRRLTLALSLWGIKQSLFWFRPGFVVSMGTIHYAKWFVIPGTDQFVFMANYDGSWENYLEDFITRAHEGQSAAWSNGVGFPKTRWLIRYGAEDGDRFKRWVRNQQRPSRFWYCRFPNLTAEQIRKNALIQDGLVRATTSTENRAWLNAFGSQQRQESEIETDEVQSIVFSGQPQSHFMTCLLISVPETQSGRLKWLRGLTGQAMEEHPRKRELEWFQWHGELKSHVMPANLRVVFGDHQSPDGATFLGLTASGLSKLGLPDAFDRTSGIASLPPVFRMGMASRKNVLGDRGLSDPSGWQWSDDPAGPVDAVLLVYGSPRENLEPTQVQSVTDGLEKDFLRARTAHQAVVEKQLQFLALCGAKLIERKETGPDLEAWQHAYGLSLDPGPIKSPIAREHFGFVDGISQPVIRGTAKASSRTSEPDMVAPGEFILGYKNNQDYFPPPFIIHAMDDVRKKLPTVTANTPLRFPFFGSYRSSSEENALELVPEDWIREFRDFGRNGTFLILRDLEQDVEGFKNFTKNQADAVNRNYPYLQNITGQKASAEWIAAKLVGRWHDGSPLVGNANRPAADINRHADNDFTYGLDDPRGLQCPLGAHIRRTNPRDSLQPGDPLEQVITNRHRLVRRGRSYVNSGASSNLSASSQSTKGMMFACICADIERQFEFVQQSWADATSFHGLNHEPDPIISALNARETGPSQHLFSIPTSGGAITLSNMRSFVTTQAGGYFFLPSRSALLFLVSRMENRAVD